MHGRWDREVHGTAGRLTIGDADVGFTGSAEPGAVAWDELGIEVVLECTGRFRTPETLAGYFERGVRKVIVAAPVKDERALNIVVGVNDDRYDPDVHDILTAASCTTNCLAPVVKVIHEGLGIEHGSITTLHDLTNTQTIVDAPHKDLRRARAAGMSLIPTTTGSATAIGLIFPELRGQARRPRGPGAAAQRLADRLRLRGGAPDHGATRSTTCCAPPPPGRWPASSATRSARSSRSTTRTIRAQGSSTRRRRWSPTGPR